MSTITPSSQYFNENAESLLSDFFGKNEKLDSLESEDHQKIISKLSDIILKVDEGTKALDNPGLNVKKVKKWSRSYDILILPVQDFINERIIKIHELVYNECSQLSDVRSIHQGRKSAGKKEGYGIKIREQEIEKLLQNKKEFKDASDEKIFLVDNTPFESSDVQTNQSAEAEVTNKKYSSITQEYSAYCTPVKNIDITVEEYMTRIEANSKLAAIIRERYSSIIQKYKEIDTTQNSFLNSFKIKHPANFFNQIELNKENSDLLNLLESLKLSIEQKVQQQPIVIKHLKKGINTEVTNIKAAKSIKKTTTEKEKEIVFYELQISLINAYINQTVSRLREIEDLLTEIKIIQEKSKSCQQIANPSNSFYISDIIKHQKDLVSLGEEIKVFSDCDEQLSKEKQGLLKEIRKIFYSQVFTQFATLKHASNDNDGEIKISIDQINLENTKEITRLLKERNELQTKSIEMDKIHKDFCSYPKTSFITTIGSKIVSTANTLSSFSYLKKQSSHEVTPSGFNHEAELDYIEINEGEIFGEFDDEHKIERDVFFGLINQYTNKKITFDVLQEKLYVILQNKFNKEEINEVFSFDQGISFDELE